MQISTVRQEMVDLYASGMSMSQVGEQTGRTPSGVLWNLRKAGVVSRTMLEGVTLRGFRTLSLDENVFDSPTREGKYWLGFLMAEVGFQPRSFTVHLQAGDVNHLFKLKSFLKAGSPVKTGVRRYASGENKTRFNAHLSISSKKIRAALETYGIVSNRTDSAVLPNSLSLDADVWRGMVDGDGSICLGGRTGNTVLLSLVGSKAIMDQFLAFVKTLCVTKASVRKIGRIFGVQLSATSAIAVIRALYEDAPVYLDRKYQIAQSILGS
jgi:hypothetical protein